MASRQMSTPMRGVTFQLSKLSLRHDAASTSTPFTRSISTSSPNHATVSSITTSIDPPPPVIPFDQQTVNATIHHFPSLEPLRFETYPANHLALPTRRDILHRAVIFEGDNTRLGTASTKWRSEVRGSARKIRPQKGSGRARLGDKKSPMLRGGGRAFGPKPRDFSTELQRKVYDLAWRTALSYRFRKGELVIVDNALEIEAPSSSLVKHIFQTHQWGSGYGRSMLVTQYERPLLQKALENNPSEGLTLTWNEVDVKSLLEGGRVVIEREALRRIFLNHREDLSKKAGFNLGSWFKQHPTHSSFRLPDFRKLLGWHEFRTLETATPAELEYLKPELYERLALQRLDQAQKLDWNAKGEQEIFAYQLLAEAKQLQAEALMKSEAYNYEESDAEEVRIKGLETRIKADEAWVGYHEALANSFRWQGPDYAADVESNEQFADDLKVQAAETQEQLDDLLGIERYEEEATEEATEVEIPNEEKR